MRDLYDALIAGGGPAITQLVTERRQENIELEFKTKANSGNGAAEKPDRINLGITLSALANSMGGLLVWGIEARKDADGVDCANSPAPVADIARFKSEVMRLVSQAIMPRHEGILVEAIPAAHPAGAGYLVIHVERSERRPHRCEFGDKQYFKRIGDSSVAMEHYDIEDSFRRFVVPTLDVMHQFHRGGSARGGGTNYNEIGVRLFLNNRSPVSARFPYLIIDAVEGTAPLNNLSFGSGWRLSEIGAGRHFTAPVDEIIHPDLSREAGRFIWIVYVEPSAAQLGVTHDALGPIRILYRCGCLNSRATEGAIEIAADDLLRLIPGAQWA
jgi:hypothetical protein